MRPSPAKLAVAAAIVIAVMAGVHLLGGAADGTSRAFAAIARNVNQSSTVQFTIHSADYTGRVYEKDGYLVRSEFQSPQAAPFDAVLMDKRAGNYLYMDSQRKVAWHPNVEFRHAPSSIYDLFTDYRNMPGYSVKTLGEKRIGNQLAAGFRLTTYVPHVGPLQCDIWTDPQTKLPVRIDTTASTPQGDPVEQTITDIQFDQPLDDILFDFTPEGYDIVAPTDLNGPPGEPAPTTDVEPTPEEPAAQLPASVETSTEPQDANITPTPTPQPPTGVAGIVVNKLTQQPVEGAMIRHKISDPNTATCSDQRGRFLLTDLDASGQYYLYLTAQGYVSQRIATTIVASRIVENIRFELDPGSRVEGIVTDAQGVPVAGATVKTFHFTNVAFVTGPDGRYEIDGLNPVTDAYSLHVTHPDYPAVSIRFVPAPVGQTVRQNVVLQPGVDVYGTVTDAQGRSLEGVTVGNTDSRAMWNCITDQTDAEGNYLLENVDLGELVLWAVHSDHALYVERTTLSPGQDSVRIDLQLEPPVPLHIRVVDQAGAPVPGVTVVIHEYNGVSNMTWQRPTTDANGCVAIPSGAAEGTIRLNPFGGGISSELQEFELGQEEYVVQVYRAGRIYGKAVSAATGEPIEEFTVKMTSSQVEKSPSGYSATWSREGIIFNSPDGHFDTGRESLPIGGSYRVTVFAEGYDPLTLDPVEVQPTSEDPNRARFDLVQATLLPGVVVDAQGQPIENATVAIFSDVERYDPRYWRTFTTDAHGVFVIAGFAKEQHYVYITAQGYAPHYCHRTQLETESDAPPRMVLTEGATIFGTVVDAQGRPRVGLTVNVTKTSDVQTGPDYPRLTSRKSTETDPNGRYELSGLSPGTCDVRLSGSGNITLATKSVQLEAGQATQVDFGDEEGFAVTGVLRRGPAPIAEADITLYLADGNRRQAQTDGQGRFRFDGIATGQHRLSIRWSEAPPWQSNARNSIERHSIEVDGDMHLDLDLGDGIVRAFIPPSVRDHDGLSVNVRRWTEIPDENEMNRHWENDHQARESSRIEANGFFVCERLRPGQYYLTLSDENRVLGITDVFEMGSSDHRDDIVFHLGHARLSIRVVDAQTARAIPQAFYAIENDLEWPFHDKRLTARSNRAAMETNAQGRATYEGLPPGRYQVSCGAVEYLWASSDFVEVENARLAQVTVALQPAAMARFTLSEHLRSRVDTDSVFIYCQVTDLDTQTTVPMRFGSYRSQQHTVRFSLAESDEDAFSQLHLPGGRYRFDYEMRPYNTARNTVEMPVYKGTATAELTTGQTAVVPLDD
ncbi:carboxypeptidase regulatory-like domain-containing protein [Anaerobaca lacustris]|uniref:Carboxypeptidase regulatory-like domain-containing protein n=1 Tax=Anaerobaca lacustris TaxID=3044600 RepID=A0AAW6U3W8_9BACT|nr:carboxypeptidase regulatory-like domain-containing protein [Sedimentisphaerales bacterium M17dextr]